MAMLLRPRFGSTRFLLGAQERETSSAGELIAGATLYFDDGDGAEKYDVNYLTLGARSDTLQNGLLALQGEEPITRRIGDSADDERYVGTLADNTQDHPVVNPTGAKGLDIPAAEAVVEAPAA